MKELKEMTKKELLDLSSKIKEELISRDVQEAKEENSPIILQLGKKYQTRKGETVMIVEVDTFVYKGINSIPHEKISERFPEFYINGRRKKDKISDGDIVKEL